jgi:RNA polymerase sigma-70 factor (ECF subfamily)
MPLVHAPESFRKQLLAALPRVRRYVRSLAFDAALADDLTQSTVERALAHWHQFDQRRDMLVWLLTIAHNAFMDVRRRDGRSTSLDPVDLQQLQDTRTVDHTDHLALRVDLLAALRRLSAEQREPLLLVCVEQLSYAEVAEVMGIPLGTVMSRVFRGRAALRQMLEGRAAPSVHGLRRVV